MTGRALHVLIALVALAAAGCAPQELRTFQGLAAGDYLQIAAPLGGSLSSLKVKRGEHVRPGEPLFSLDSSALSAVRKEAEQAVKAARRELALARRSGDARQAADAQSRISVAESRLAEIGWRLEQTRPTAPGEALVVDTLFSEGQWVPAGSTVVSLVSAGAMKVQFLVPSHVAGTLRHGQRVEVRCTECGAPIAAEISYISPIAQAADGTGAGSDVPAGFLVEARPNKGAVAALRPGHPVEVVL